MIVADDCDDHWRASLFSPTGEPLRSIPLDPMFAYGDILYDGRHYLLLSGDQLPEQGMWLFDLDGQPLGRAYPSVVGRYQGILARGGRELWIVGVESKEVERYAMPGR